MPTNLRRILVTGATGMIGSRLLPRLLAQDLTVIALAHSQLPSLSAHRGDLIVEHGDLSNLELLEKLVGGVDAVCHLGGYVPQDLQGDNEAEHCLAVNAIGALNVARAVASAGKRLVAASSAQGYRYSENPVSEENPVYPSNRASFYLVSKLVGEIYIEHYRFSRNLDATTFRIGSCYGPGTSKKSVIGQFVDGARAGQPLEVWHGGVPTSDLVYVEDVVELLILALQTKSVGLFNLGSGVATSALDLAEEVNGVFGDGRAEIVVRPVGQVVPPSFPALSMHKAGETWGWQPTLLRDGLARWKSELEHATCG